MARANEDPSMSSWKRTCIRNGKVAKPKTTHADMPWHDMTWHANVTTRHDGYHFISFHPLHYGVYQSVTMLSVTELCVCVCVWQDCVTELFVCVCATMLCVTMLVWCWLKGGREEEEEEGTTGKRESDMFNMDTGYCIPHQIDCLKSYSANFPVLVAPSPIWSVKPLHVLVSLSLIDSWSWWFVDPLTLQTPPALCPTEIPLEPPQ